MGREGAALKGEWLSAVVPAVWIEGGLAVPGAAPLVGIEKLLTRDAGLLADGA